MNILVTGASGFIGLNLTKRLAQKHRVRVLVRKDSNISALKKIKNIEFAGGDVLHFSSLLKALEGIDVVYHLAASLKPASEKLLWDVNVIGTRNILKAARLTKSIKQFVHCSSAYVEWGSPQTLYEKTKLEGEKVAVKLIGNVNFPITIIRPGFVYGPYTTGLLPLFQSVLKKSFFLVGGGKHLFELTYIDDLVDVFEKVMMNKKAFNQTFVISEENPRSFAEVVLHITKLLKIKYTPIKIPKVVFRVLVELALALKSITKLDIPISRDTYKTMAVDRVFDSTHAKNILGYKASIKIEQGLKELIAWYRKNNLLA